MTDSQSHVIRTVNLDDKAGTLAGRPGKAGHQDSDDPGAALFDTPQGLAVTKGGVVFVADQGLCVGKEMTVQIE